MERIPQNLPQLCSSLHEHLCLSPPPPVLSNPCVHWGSLGWPHFQFNPERCRAMCPLAMNLSMPGPGLWFQQQWCSGSPVGLTMGGCAGSQPPCLLTPALLISPDSLPPLSFCSFCQCQVLISFFKEFIRLHLMAHSICTWRAGNTHIYTLIYIFLLLILGILSSQGNCLQERSVECDQRLRQHSSRKDVLPKGIDSRPTKELANIFEL